MYKLIKTNMSKTAIIVVDPQNDFISGTLTVPNATEIIELINELTTSNEFDFVIFTQDWHPEKHKSFVTEHPNNNVFDVIEMGGVKQTVWPEHCVQNTWGSEFHEDINLNINNLYIFKKGMDIEVDSHSGFYDNTHNKSTGLTEFLREKNVSDIYICGLATDVCVEYTAIDGANDNFNTTVIIDACRGIAEDLEPSYKRMQDKNVKLIEYMDLIV